MKTERLNEAREALETQMYDSADRQLLIALIDAELERSIGCWYCEGIESHSIAIVKTVMDEYGHELGAYDTPYNYCPNCSRDLRGDT